MKIGQAIAVSQASDDLVQFMIVGIEMERNEWFWKRQGESKQH